MPRNYIKKTSGPKYTKDDLKKAVLEVKNGSTIYAASQKFSVPEETVRRWVVKSPSHQGPGRSFYLTNEEKMCIVKGHRTPYSHYRKENNQEYTKTDSSTSIASSEAVSLDSLLKDLKKAILQTLSPTPSVNTVLAIENSKEKRKRVQSKLCEVLTDETVLGRLTVEERDRKKKFSQANIEKDLKNSEESDHKKNFCQEKERQNIQNPKAEELRKVEEMKQIM
ncbi:hypothetical protein AVEN_241135-1 [Araneus ventricosus]|uniref:HTH psq-type domain-containing protein n=1 Tax=Araneus ventricosus TaxID=182803 RepID=A0A4Y2J8B3_ARAVE|nr:hypothetical protein AVEN_241135-1 [Araneus ventricosus]